MTTVLAVGNSEGTRRCDATCHKAEKPDCACICGGRYHGSNVGRLSGEPDRALERCVNDVAAGVWGEGLAEAARSVKREIDRNERRQLRLDDDEPRAVKEAIGS